MVNLVDIGDVPALDVWGNTVNLASRLESSGGPGVIQVCDTTYEKLKNRYQFEGDRTAELGNNRPNPKYRLCGR
jgi:urea transport system substrate-binding protein